MANTKQIFKPRDKEGVSRQKMMAQAMMDAGMAGAPTEWNRMRVVPQYTAGHALTQLAQAMGGAYLQKKANEADKDIDAERRKKLADAMGIPSMTKGYELPEGEQGPVRDPNNLPKARENQQALQQFNDTVPLDIQEQIMQSRAIQKAFPAPPQEFDLAKGAKRFRGSEIIAENPDIQEPKDTRTDDIKEYESAVAQGYKGSLEDWIVQMKRAGKTDVTVNTGDHTLPKPGEGLYRPNAKQPGLKFEPGSEQERAYKEARTKATTAFASSMDSMQRTWKTVDELLKMDTSGITGSIQGTEYGGKVSRVLDLSNKSSNAHAKLQSLLAQMGFKELADMRASSPTGGALGSITERELQLLQNAAATLMTTQDDKSFRAALATIQAQLEKSALNLHQAYKTDFDENYQQPAPQIHPQQPPAPIPPSGQRQPPNNQMPPAQPNMEAIARANSYYGAG